MYIAMNRFRVHAGQEEVFEEVWRSRERFLDQVPGFQRFQLLRGATQEAETEFISHSTWASEAAFRDWTGSATAPGFREEEGKERELDQKAITDSIPANATTAPTSGRLALKTVLLTCCMTAP